MEAWGNFWQKGHSTTFGEYYADGYTKGYIADWWSTIVSQREEKALNILEVGCGNASLVPCLLDLNIKGTYTGVDAAQVQLSEAVQKRGNHNLTLSLHSETGIEKFQSTEQFDLIASVYGLEYSPLEQSLPLLKKLLAPDGQLTLLMHHAKSVITEMSVKALTEFDFDQMKKIVTYINDINDELNQCQGDLKALSKSPKAETARESVNEFISSVMNKSTAERNPILVDFSQSVLAFFKKIRQPEHQRRDFIDSILPDFHASKERFVQMVNVARNDTEIKTFQTQLTDAGFTNIKINPINNEGVPVAWNVHAN
ncbi:MAG: class I SAM-dependent methyltransferase [Porticoccaceae bacterium]|nr:class I SAM-dependent methyltransferase [Porticoccaceae bacterium]